MEEDQKQLLEISISASGSPSPSRWNPTREQINILEGLYRQGIRTPSAEQIQHITSRLKAYGHIEGKNVFYWFQNHKARQRQKQKQESMVYVNRFMNIKSPAPIMPSPCTNSVPFCLPPAGVSVYPHFPKVLLPGGFKRRDKEEKGFERRTEPGGERCEPVYPVKDSMVSEEDNVYSHETLQLFPLHPTGILGRSGKSSSSSSSETNEFEKTEEGGGEQPFFNFFGKHPPSEPDRW